MNSITLYILEKKSDPLSGAQKQLDDWSYDIDMKKKNLKKLKSRTNKYTNTKNKPMTKDQKIVAGTGVLGAMFGGAYGLSRALKGKGDPELLGNLGAAGGTIAGGLIGYGYNKFKKKASEKLMFKVESNKENFAGTNEPHHETIRSVVKSTPNYIAEKLKLKTPFKKTEI